MAEPAPDATSKRSLLFVIIIAVVIVLVIVAPLAYRAWQSRQLLTENRYNGFDFVEQQFGNLTLWTTVIQARDQAYTIPFYFHPSETESVVMQPNITQRLRRNDLQPEVLYISFHPDAGSEAVIAGVEISRITGFRYNLLNIETHSALHEPVGSAETVIITCEDATASTGVIFFEEGDHSLVTEDAQNPYCIRLQYKDPGDAKRVADRFIYGILRIMPG